MRLRRVVLQLLAPVSAVILAMALTAVARLAHRGAASNDKSGDGAGVLTQIPHRLLGVGPVERVALGMFFLPQAAAARDVAVRAAR